MMIGERGGGDSPKQVLRADREGGWIKGREKADGVQDMQGVAKAQPRRLKGVSLCRQDRTSDESLRLLRKKQLSMLEDARHEL